MNAFHVCGGILALWALLVAFLGITREDFPGSTPAARLVGAISVLLALTTIGAAIATGEKHHAGEEHGEEAALRLPSL